MTKGYVLIVGAKSEIAKAIARVYAEHGYDLYLAGRGRKELSVIANDIKIRTERDVHVVELDILDFSSHHSIYDNLPEKPVGVICAVGYLGDQKRAETDFEEASRIIDTNYKGIVSFLNIVSGDFERRKSGFIIGISSVAGDRGRKKNYIYGSAKAALSAYLSGLRNRLDKFGVSVLTVKPGFVETKMTEGMNLPSALTAKPEQVALEIFEAQQKGKDVIYVKKVWRWIMLFIRLLPEKIFKNIDL